MTRALINFELPDPYFHQLQQNYPQLEWVRCTDSEKLPALLKETEILLTFLQCDRKMIDAASQLKWIQAISAGVDYMPLDEIRRRGIVLTNGRGIHKIHMAEYAVAAMINLARGFHLLFRNQLQKKWERSVPQEEIHGATVGIIGLGVIGAEIAKKAALMGMRVIGVKRIPGPVDHVEEVHAPDDMAAVFRRSDYIINLLPYTQETEKLIDQRFFDQMKPTACFINIGRGRTVNEDDLIEALRNKKIRAMVSDVYYTEPLPPESPLWDLDNVILTPHICGVSPQYMARAMQIIAHNLNVYLSGQGEMINLVDMQAGY
ncbi:MAG: D-2-hydroxyacid dehydrogenase [Desulfobacterales bacterium]|jgi:phosphoglycerate dehydrogenase-like enzyme